jgi:hypothetical protein
MRNDLSEADQEVVVLKAGRGKAPDGAEPSPVAGASQRPLARIAAKLFATGRFG